jgi:Xaa-Pro aminopeptidase
MYSYTFEAGGEVQKREAAAKREIITGLLQKNKVDGLILNTQANFAWASGGANNWVSIADTTGVANLVFKADGAAYAVLDNLEGPRFESEEKLGRLGFELIEAPWWESDKRSRLLLDLARGHGKQTQVASDTEMEGTLNWAEEVAHARWSLIADERDRYRQVCRAAAEALESTCLEITPGMSEWEVAGYLSQACYARGLVPFVTLVAADDRIFNYRHPIPTFNTIDNYVMVVLCAKGGGLIANCTRLVHFGPVTPDILEKQRHVQTIDATFNLNSKPGAVAGEIFAKAQQAYAYAGYPNEWQLHHQGGATGYAGRDYRAGPDSTDVVVEWQAFAWNPSITGTKSEDTVLVSSEPGHELEVLTRTPESTWPTVTVSIEGLGSMERPDILER